MYLVNDGSVVKPNFFFIKTGIRCSFDYISRGQMWDRYRKITEDNFGRKE